MKLYWQVIKESVSNFTANNFMTHAASIAFYTIFSLPAVLIITVVVGATFYEESTVQDELIRQIGAVIGDNTAGEIQKILKNASLESSGYLAKIIGIGALVFSATTVFISLQNGLNSVWRVRSKPERGWLKFVIDRFLSMTMVVSIGFILLVSLVIDTMLSVLQQSISVYVSNVAVYLVTILNILVSLGFITLMFALLFRVLPDAKIQWRDVWVGSIITTMLFVIGKFLIGFYIGTSSLTSTYGAAGSLVVILIWVYYSSVLVLFGAEITYVYTYKRGRKIVPYKNAVRIEIIESEVEDVAKEGAGVEKKSIDEEENIPQ